MASNRRLAANFFSGVAVNIFRICVQIVMLPLMARLLGPSEMGLYQMVWPMFSFVLLLADAGLGDSLARAKTEDTRVWSSAFWGLLIGGAILSVGLYFTSWFFADLSGQPRLPQIMLAFSLSLFLVCATVIPQARLLREGNLLPGNIGDFFATLAGAAIGILMAYKGYGVWAMVAQFISTSVIRTIILNWLRPFLPRFEFDIKALLAHSDIGGAILCTRLIDTGSRQAEATQVLVKLGEASLGSYGLANQIGRFFSDSVSNSLWANLYYIAINRSADETLRHYAYSHRTFALFVFPAVAVLALAMPRLVPILLGPQWLDSTYPIMIMLLISPLGSLGGLSTAVLFARRQFRAIITTIAFFTLIRVLIPFVAYPYGVTVLCLCVALQILGFYLYIVFGMSRLIGSKPSDLLFGIAGPVMATAITGLCFYFLLSAMQGIVGLVLAGLIALPIYVGALFVVDSRRMQADLIAAKAMLQKKPDAV